MDRPLQFATQLAQKAGNLLSDRFQLQGTRGTLKPDRTVVTEADLAANQLICDAIQEAYPEDGIISEESNTIVERSDKPVWVIDPLDGTTNFSLGLHVWGVSIGRLVDGMPDSAAIYFPLLGELYTAQSGQGAILNDKPIQVKPLEKDQPAAFLALSSHTFKHYEVKMRYKPRVIGSACYDLCLVARGAAIIGFLAKPKIWDIAAGWLVVEEAGGIVKTHDGIMPFPLSPNKDYEEESYPTIIAADKDLMQQAREGIRQKK
ncbi:MAG: inositol monophosphatase [Anaerolineales bacterium]|jgi:myo-inositol-1(or 4)-monophosphatase